MKSPVIVELDQIIFHLFKNKLKYSMSLCINNYLNSKVKLVKLKISFNTPYYKNYDSQRCVVSFPPPHSSYGHGFSRFVIKGNSDNIDLIQMIKDGGPGLKVNVNSTGVSSKYGKINYEFSGPLIGPFSYPGSNYYLFTRKNPLCISW